MQSGFSKSAGYERLYFSFIVPRQPAAILIAVLPDVGWPLCLQEILKRDGESAILFARELCQIPTVSGKEKTSPASASLFDVCMGLEMQCNFFAMFPWSRQLPHM